MTRPKTRKRETCCTILCEWCGEQKEVTRTDVKTCSGKCRSRRARFFALCGFYPDSIPGNVSVQTAYQLLILELLAREKARRELVSINNRKAAELLYPAKNEATGRARIDER